MRFAERLTARTHASDRRLLAIVAGEPASAHVASCAPCQARLEGLRGWAARVSADGAAIADEIFTAERLTRQRARILKRLEAASRPARVITFPAGVPVPAAPGTPRVFRWAAAAALGGLMVGLGAGALFVSADREPAPVSASAPGPAALPLSAIVASEHPAPDALDLDEEGLLNAAYERVDVDALRTIDDITPRAREVAVNLPRRPLP